MSDSGRLLDEGEAVFSIESRLLRELGERLVKQPDVALLELIKNAYDADAEICQVTVNTGSLIEVSDTGQGMTLEQFISGWMRIGTSSKAKRTHSPKYGREITGEKGIGRFAVRFLWRHLSLTSVADDAKRGRTKLSARFDWPKFDRGEDLGLVRVPYELRQAESDEKCGTTLLVTSLREAVQEVDLASVRTASFSLLSPYRSLFSSKFALKSQDDTHASHAADPGFSLTLRVISADSEASLAPLEQSNTEDVAGKVLANYVLRARLIARDGRLKLALFRRGEKKPVVEFDDAFEGLDRIGSPVFADIRFFPRRKGTFQGLNVDGRKASSWVTAHGGIAVFDRTFRVLPYGSKGDDWLHLAADTAKRERNPSSSLSAKYFPMDEAQKKSTQLNYMLRLPYPRQLVGIVQVRGLRTGQGTGQTGLTAAADREGFVANEAYRKLRDLVRGAVEAIAWLDRDIQLENLRKEQSATLAKVREQTQSAIREVRSNAAIPGPEKDRIIEWIASTGTLAEKHEQQSKERESALETMSLLGIISGFMTHEFGTALGHLEEAQALMLSSTDLVPDLKHKVAALREIRSQLGEFVSYSQAYIKGATLVPERPYTARSRIMQVKRAFRSYSAERSIAIEIEAGRQVNAPRVPISLYSGVVLNLFTNALKAVTAKAGEGERRILVSAENTKSRHTVRVCDTGIGIPVALRERVFEPLFTTTGSMDDPLGSGMGLGLSLVKRAVGNFNGIVRVVSPPEGFATCVEVQFPVGEW